MRRNKVWKIKVCDDVTVPTCARDAALPALHFLTSYHYHGGVLGSTSHRIRSVVVRYTLRHDPPRRDTRPRASRLRSHLPDAARRLPRVRVSRVMPL